MLKLTKYFTKSDLNKNFIDLADFIKKNPIEVNNYQIFPDDSICIEYWFRPLEEIKKQIKGE